MEGLTLPSTPVPRISKIEFAVSPTPNKEAYMVSAWGEEPLYPHSQVAEMHAFIQQPHLAAILGWFGITSARTRGRHTIMIPTTQSLGKKIETINHHLEYPIPRLTLCNDSMGDSDHLSFHGQTMLPVCEQTLHGTDWKAWHNTVHDLLTHATNWILAPQEAHAISQAAALRSRSAAPDVKSEVSEMIDELYSIDGIGSCIQTQSFSRLMNDPSNESIWRTTASLSALSMTDFDLLARWSFWQASQDRIKQLETAVQTIKSGEA